MHVKVLSLALVAAIIALPVPASQLLAGSSPAHSQARIVPGTDNLHLLLADPFMAGEFALRPVRSAFEAEPGF